MSQPQGVRLEQLQGHYGRRIAALTDEIVGLELTVEAMQGEIARLQQENRDLKGESAEGAPQANPGSFAPPIPPLDEEAAPAV